MLQIRRILTANPLGASGRAVRAVIDGRYVVVRTRIQSGHKMFVNLGSTVGRSISLWGTYEESTAWWLKGIGRPGDVFVDVGANIGYFSLLASSLSDLNGRYTPLSLIPLVLSYFCGILA